MADDGLEISKGLKSTRGVYRSLKLIKTKRTKQRRLRRKRSKLKYFKGLREFRVVNQHTNNLCASLSVFNITDMQSAPQENFPTLPREVSDWQYFHQLAYWKSRAVSLEYENKMLHSHIKKMCSKEIGDYVAAQQELGYDGTSQVADMNHEQPRDFGKEDHSEQDQEEEVETPENRKELYGEFEQKISGMETAMDVNYHMQVDNSKASMWPNIPLNL